MLLNKCLPVYGLVVCVTVLQSGCKPSTVNDERMPTNVSSTDVKPTACGDLLNYHSGLAAQTNEETPGVDATISPVEQALDACPKLRKAILLSMPGLNHQNDKEALELLKDLKRSGMLAGSDLHFSNMLLQHVSQRQDLRDYIAAQQQHLVELETQNTVLRNRITTLKSQLNQLKNIEVEIDKKERSLTSPIND